MSDSRTVQHHSCSLIGEGAQVVKYVKYYKADVERTQMTRVYFSVRGDVTPHQLRKLAENAAKNVEEWQTEPHGYEAFDPEEITSEEASEYMLDLEADVGKKEHQTLATRPLGSLSKESDD